jgi:intraflagellar transport protein 20
MASQLRNVALQVELAKLKAIGKRNLLQQESERKSQQKQEMEERMKERRAEIARYRVELASLKRIEAEQLALIEKLQGN